MNNRIIAAKTWTKMLPPRAQNAPVLVQIALNPLELLTH
jgi:hypothetical protein